MEAKPDKKRKGYKLIYSRGLELITNYFPDYEIGSNSLDSREEVESFSNEEEEFKIEFQAVTWDTINYYSTGLDVLRRGEKLSLLLWQDFENFIAELLLRKGWCVSQNNKPPNRGINITTTKRDKNLGLFKYIWITKKYSSHRPVGIKTIRELDYLISQTKASKGVIVTTSRLTKGALKMIEENEFKMFYIDNEMLEKEFNANEIDIADDLPFNSSLFRKIEYCRLL